MAKMLVDVYREQLSMISILHAFVIGLYFALSIWLPAERVRWSGFVLGVSHSISGIGAVLTVQVLIRRYVLWNLVSNNMHRMWYFTHNIHVVRFLHTAVVRISCSPSGGGRGIWGY